MKWKKKTFSIFDQFINIELQWYSTLFRLSQPQLGIGWMAWAELGNNLRNMKQILYYTVIKPDYGHWSSRQCPVVQFSQLPPINGKGEGGGVFIHLYMFLSIWLISKQKRNFIGWGVNPPSIGKRPIYFGFFLFKASLLSFPSSSKKTFGFKKLETK